MEISLYYLGLPLSAIEISANRFDHFFLAARSVASDRITFNILIQKFIGIQFRTIGRKIDPFDMVGMMFKEPCHYHGFMHWMLINNEIHSLSAAVQYQSLEELYHHRGRKTSFENHKTEFPSVGNSRDHIAAKPFSRARNNRCVTSTTIGSSCGMVGTQPHFVTPVNTGFFTLCAGNQARVFYPQPSPNLFGFLFKSSTTRLLGGKTPHGQPSPNCPQGTVNAKPTGNKLLDCLARPKIKWQLQLIRTLIFNGPQNYPQLFGTQRAFLWPSPGLCLQGLLAILKISVDPFIYSLTGYIKNAGTFNACLTTEHGMHRFAAESFLGFRTQRTSILTSHARNISFSQITCNLFNALISNGIFFAEQRLKQAEVGIEA